MLAELGPGATLLLPGSWPHAVVTQQDSLVVGGNFLHALDLRCGVLPDLARLSLSRCSYVRSHAGQCSFILSDASVVLHERWCNTTWVSPELMRSSETVDDAIRAPIWCTAWDSSSQYGAWSLLRASMMCICICGCKELSRVSRVPNG